MRTRSAVPRREGCSLRPPASFLPPPVPSSGFTITELIVAVALFVVLLGAVSGVSLTFVNRHREQRAQQTLQQDILAFLGVLDREIQTGFGTTFADVNGDGSAFCFENQNGTWVRYERFDDGGVGRIARVASDGAASCADVPAAAADDLMTSARTDITRLAFIGIETPGVDAGPPVLLTGRQGRATVVLRACPVGRASDGGPFGQCLDVQMTLTSRQHGSPP